MRFFKRITALALAAVTAGAVGLSAAAEIEETAAEPAELKVYCPTNDDSEFPFNMYINVYEDSIQYIELDEPIYGFERLLDEEALEFDVNFSLKDEFKSFDSYTFTVFNSNYSEELASEQMASDGVLNLTGLSLGSGYKISMILESDSLNAYYGGHFTIQAELDSTLAVDLFYKSAGMDGEAAPFANEREEDDEKNNSSQTPDTLNHTGIRAYTGTGDVDYFKCPIPSWIGDDGEEEITRGVATLELSVTTGGYSIPDFTVEIFDGYGNHVTSYTSNIPLRTVAYFRIPNIPLNESYMIKITSSKEFYVQYVLSRTVTYGLAWFGQYNSKDVDGVYWNVDKLDSITHYAPKTGTTYRIFQEGVTYNTHEFATACGVVSSAMIFRNYGVTMNGYDVRTGYEGVLQADPFTAMLSNCESDGSFLKTTNKFPNYPYPDECHREVIGDKFGLTYNKITNITETSLRNAIAAHGYVLIYFDEGVEEKQHFMVLTGLASQNDDFFKIATVYDPAASTYAAGAGVLLSETSSGHNKDTISHITSAGYFI